jgi:hypothetical protein
VHRSKNYRKNAAAGNSLCLLGFCDVLTTREVFSLPGDAPEQHKCRLIRTRNTIVSLRWRYLCGEIPRLIETQGFAGKKLSAQAR